MNRMQPRLTLHVGKVGLAGKLRENGVIVEARVDNTAFATFVSPSFVSSIYGREEDVPTKPDPTEAGMKFTRVPLTVGIETEGGSLIHSEVDAFIFGKDEELVVGTDVLDKLGLKLIFDYSQKRVLVESFGWRNFEDEVASIYRSLGGDVKQNATLAGFQIDILVDEVTASRRHLRLAVECKFYKERIGNRVVNDFVRVVETLKQAGLVEKGVIVSSSGFTSDARLVAESTRIDIMTLDDLRQIARNRGLKPEEPSPKPVTGISQEAKSVPRAFVVMPFLPELEDMYYLGIREVVSELGGACERADELVYVGGVVEKIYHSIRTADIIVAELTTPNPNVYYEIGYAHALGKPTILLTRDVKTTQFDMQGYNHVIYSSIVDLREKLRVILSQALHFGDNNLKLS